MKTVLRQKVIKQIIFNTSTLVLMFENNFQKDSSKKNRAYLWRKKSCGECENIWGVYFSVPYVHNSGREHFRNHAYHR